MQLRGKLICSLNFLAVRQGISIRLQMADDFNLQRMEDQQQQGKRIRKRVKKLQLEKEKGEGGGGERDDV